MNARKIKIDVKVTADDIEAKHYVCNEIGCLQLVCLQQFNSEKSLKKHLCEKHYNVKFTEKIHYRFSCPVLICRRSLKMDNEYFNTRKHLHQHFQKVHSVGKYKCTNEPCEKMFATETLRNLHLKNCGRVFTCHCELNFNSNEALLTHQKRKHPNVLRTKKIHKLIQKNDKLVQKNDKSIQKNDDDHTKNPTTTRTVSTTTSGLGLWNSSENLSNRAATTSIFTSTDQPIASTSVSAVKAIKTSSTSTAEDFIREENSNSLSSSSSNQKKLMNWNGDFEDMNNIFDNDVKMEFYSAETQTDFSDNLFNNNYTQTTFSDLYDFEKFDIQTQTNWDE